MTSHSARCVVALVATLLLSCDESPTPVIAQVQLLGLPVSCVQVSASADTGGFEQTRFIHIHEGTDPQVAIYPNDSLGNGKITLAADGFSGDSCSAWIATSDPVAAAFGPQDGGPVLVPLRGCGGRPCDDGGEPDAGTTCGEGRDAGEACGDVGACSRDGVCVPGFLYPPSNFDPATITNIAPPITLDCKTSFDSTTRTFSNDWCGQPVPLPLQISQKDGVPAILLAVSDFTVTGGGSLRLTGSLPVIFAVFGNATLEGSVLTNAGADLNPACALARGEMGFDDSVAGGGAGGGGGFGTTGGDGGSGGGLISGGGGGWPAGSSALVPLIGGCSGGQGGSGIGTGGSPGSAGGAFQCSASGTLQIAAIIGAPGQGGRHGAPGGANGQSGGGGGGAGSGGGILLEGQVVQVTNTALITANGGGGGAGGGFTVTGADGEPGSITSAAPAQGGSTVSTIAGFGGDGGSGISAVRDGLPGTIAMNSGGGGGGAGGAVGRIRINAAADGGCDITTKVLSPPPTGNGSPGCP